MIPIDSRVAVGERKGVELLSWRNRRDLLGMDDFVGCQLSFSEKERKILYIRTSRCYQTMHWLDISEGDCETIAKACELDPKLRSVLESLVEAVILRAEEEAMEHIDMIVRGVPRSEIKPAEPRKR